MKVTTPKDDSNATGVNFETEDQISFNTSTNFMQVISEVSCDIL